ncbi:MAG: GspH/FimT family pseudopilin [Xanthomonadales bacterium]|nr:GspH/FimT family pseudopilin [Xanthomonadales bacterium]
MKTNHILLRCPMPTRAYTRRDPQKGKNGFSKVKGFTVIELMVALAVIAIITSLALPSYRTLIEKRQVTSGAEQIMAFLSSAQMEAVKRNQFVAVNMNSDANGWCLGMTAGDSADVACDCLDQVSSCTLDGTPRLFRSENLGNPDVFSPADSTFGGDDNIIVFDPVRGLVVGGESVELELLSDDTSYALNVELSPVGRSSICSDTARSSYAAPGFRECQ